MRTFVLWRRSRTRGGSRFEMVEVIGIGKEAFSTALEAVGIVSILRSSMRIDE